MKLHEKKEEICHLLVHNAKLPPDSIPIDSALARRWRRQNDAVATVANIEMMLARSEMLSRPLIIFSVLNK